MAQIKLQLLFQFYLFFYLVNLCLSFSDNWFGMLHSCSDSKKKSNLMLSVFEPGQPFPWLGDMKKLGPANELNPNPYHFDANANIEESPFPIPPAVRRSYHAQVNAVWIKSSGLQVNGSFYTILMCTKSFI